MSVLRKDYIGFSYNGKHSSELGILRTGDGSRFNENLLPTMQDKTVQVPGGDGTYYFGSYFTQRQIPVSFAFDSLTEEQISEIKALFGDKQIHDLVFDERPYKVYRAKVTGTATLKYIPFAEGETNRVYKGEGTIQFTCYQPYAICTKKWLEDYTEDWENIDEWKAASGLYESNGRYDKVNNSGKIDLYNPGNIESPFTLKLKFDYIYTPITLNENSYESGVYFVYRDGHYYISSSGYNKGETYYEISESKAIAAGSVFIEGLSSSTLSWKKIPVSGEDAYVKINSKTNLIEGYTSQDRKSGNVYNKYITGGSFFNIPLGEKRMATTNLIQHLEKDSLEYNYYYF